MKNRNMQLAIQYQQWYWAANIMLDLYAEYVEGYINSAMVEYNRLALTMPREVWVALRELNTGMFGELNVKLDIMLGV